MTVKEDLENRIREYLEFDNALGYALAELCTATLKKMPEETLNKELESEES